MRSLRRHHPHLLTSSHSSVLDLYDASVLNGQPRPHNGPSSHHLLLLLLLLLLLHGEPLLHDVLGNLLHLLTSRLSRHPLDGSYHGGTPGARGSLDVNHPRGNITSPSSSCSSLPASSSDPGAGRSYSSCHHPSWLTFQRLLLLL